MVDIEKIIEYWVQTSDKDYVTASNLFSSQDYHWSLFLGHLVLEKLFKAVYVQATGQNPPRIHDLVRLCEKCNLTFDDDLLEKLEFITRFNMSVRYPDYQQEFYRLCTKEFTQDAFEKIDEVRLWLKSLIKIS